MTLIFKRLALGLTCIIFFGTLFVPSVSYAEQKSLQEQITQQIDTGAQNAGFVGKAKDPRELISQIIAVVLELVGTIFLILLALAGYWLFTARGEEEKVEKAKTTIRFATVGLLIVLISYSITLFVGKVILDAKTGEAPAAEGVRARGLNPLNWE